MKDAEKLGTTYDGERSLRLEIEELSTCISIDPSFPKEINHQEEENMHRDYIEIWLQEVIIAQFHSLL